MISAQARAVPAAPIRRRYTDSRVNLSSNELVHPGVDAVLGAVPAALTPDVLRRYPPSAETVERLAGYVGVRPEQLVLTPGSDSALRLICAYHHRRTGGRGTVLLQHPNYPAWEETATLLGLPIHRVPADCADPARQDQQLVDAAWAACGMLVAVSVPNGPVGGCLSPAALDQLAQASRERGHLLVIDSCYQAFHGRLTEQIERAGDTVVVVQSLSKSHGLAGARVALLCGEPRLVEDLAPGPLEHAVSGATLLAARVAIEHHAAFQAIWEEISQVRKRTREVLHCAGWPTVASGGNFITVRLGSTTAAAVTARLSSAGYRVRHLSDYPDLAGYLRFTVADRATNDRFLAELLATLPTEASREVA
ncbi:MAG TPA: aminotransferase class I/II-fold pyridoxal phosphate-dependent enzyme [Micromonosporaceae bacterium]|nr:aminotransferase class I/II-fold pyridoxal phosphate-dependent enzyme [Micromonosporaceae bacterium]